MIAAQVICDSVSPHGIRLTTMQLRYPKFIHGEFMTHRVFSRNASSSRAIPTAKLLEEVRDDAQRAAPVFWGKNQKGMQAAEELDDRRHPELSSRQVYRSDREEAQDIWRRAAHHAADMAEDLSRLGAHKQIVNRLLEPFSHINVVVTSSKWDNFYTLRRHPDAQPEMRALAEAIWNAQFKSVPGSMPPGVWHLPYVRGEEFQSYAEDDSDIQSLIKVSVARCARVSYLSNDTGKQSTIEEDLKLYDRLLSAHPLHASPAEHQATPDDCKINPLWDRPDVKQNEVQPGVTWNSKVVWANSHEHGNFHGWRQYRKMLPGENADG